MKMNQIVGGAIILVVIFLRWGLPLLDFRPEGEKLTPEEQAIADRWSPLIEGDHAELMRNNLLAASNYFAMDHNSDDQVFETKDDYTLGMLVLNRLTYSNGVDLAVQYPEFIEELYEYYESKLPVEEDFKVDQLVSVNRKVAKILKEID